MSDKICPRDTDGDGDCGSRQCRIDGCAYLSLTEPDSAGPDDQLDLGPFGDGLDHDHLHGRRT